MLLFACGDPPKMSNLSGGVSAGGSATATNGSGSTLTGANGTEGTSGEGSSAASEGSEGDSSGSSDTDADTDSGEGSASSAGSASDTGGEESSGSEASTSSSTTEGAEESGSTGGGLIGPDGVLDITIYGANDCTFATDPAQIVVPEGTGFSVNWVNHPSSEVEVDVAKIDASNSVPILIGLEIGNSHHDNVHEWCGDVFNGTFSFRLTSCHEPHYIDVDCGG